MDYLHSIFQSNVLLSSSCELASITMVAPVFCFVMFFVQALVEANRLACTLSSSIEAFMRSVLQVDEDTF